MDVKRITILCQEFPYPPNHGGSIDTFNRIRALKKLGYAIQLLAWEWKVGPDSEARCGETVKEWVDDFILIKRSLPVNFRLFAYPFRMLSFKMDPGRLQEVAMRIKAFSPDFFLLDGWGAYLGLLQLKANVPLPYYYRSHNIEFLYLREVFAASHRLFSKMKIALNLTNMKRMEINIRKGAEKVFDISTEDQQFWGDFSEESMPRNSILLYPTFFEQAMETPEENFDGQTKLVLFVGNLWSPSNIAGLIWFIDNIAGKLLNNRQQKESVGKMKIVFAGSNPKPKLLNHPLVKSGGITVLANVSEEEKNSLLRQAMVFINPVQWSQGINIKMIEMLHYNKPIVSTLAGVRGLPVLLQDAVQATNSAEEFFGLIMEAMQNGEREPINNNLLLGRYFRGDALLKIW